MEQRQSDKYWRRYRELLEGRYAVLSFDSAAAELFGMLAARLRDAGRTNPIVDLLIAATAMHHGLIVATLNIRHFKDIPELQTEDWSGGAISR